MPSIFENYIGASDEETYGTAATVSRFFELSNESVSGQYERIESAAVQSGHRVLKANRFAPNPKGAEGGLELEVLDKGYAFWLKHMLGNVSAGEPDTDGFTTFNASIGDMSGKSFTVEIGRVDSGGTLNQFVYSGGKVSSWEIANEVDGVLNLNVDCIFAKEAVRSGAPVTPTYPAGAKLFTYLGGTFTVDGATIAVNEVSLKGDNGLKDDRWTIGMGRREPLEQSAREITFEFTGDFDDVSAHNKVSAASDAGSLGELVLTWAGVAPDPGSPLIVPTLTVTIPHARFDEATANAQAGELSEISITGKALNGSSNDAISIAYKSLDAAV
ncbi:phage tail tube protein [Streptomyces smyrnaeus]|uniref:phage tail tube protein n=1 Tax=Streptomyces smyrnaeus TaxID=1387713 RepID=UPI0036CDA612